MTSYQAQYLREVLDHLLNHDDQFGDCNPEEILEVVKHWVAERPVPVLTEEQLKLYGSSAPTLQEVVEKATEAAKNKG